MGREVKRVALDFDWPLDNVWEGFLNPHYGECTNCVHCKGSGSSPEMRALKDRWYGYVPFRPEERGSVPFAVHDDAIMLFARRNVAHAPDYYGSGAVAIIHEADRLRRLFNGSWSHHLNDADVAALIAAGRLMDFTHTWTKEGGWQRKVTAYMPTAREVNIWSISGGMGHDSTNQWVVCEAECKRLGAPVECAHCHGKGSFWTSPEAKQRAVNWTREEPPTGDGYQIWETVSEGSPISPVFATPEELARYMAGRKWGADKGSPYEHWLAFIRGPGWAPSMVIADGVVRTGPIVLGASA